MQQLHALAYPPRRWPVARPLTTADRRELYLPFNVAIRASVRGQAHVLLLSEGDRLYGYGDNFGQPLGSLAGRGLWPTLLHFEELVADCAAGVRYTVLLTCQGTVWVSGTVPGIMETTAFEPWLVHAPVTALRVGEGRTLLLLETGEVILAIPEGDGMREACVLVPVPQPIRDAYFYKGVLLLLGIRGTLYRGRVTEDVNDTVRRLPSTAADRGGVTLDYTVVREGVACLLPGKRPRVKMVVPAGSSAWAGVMSLSLPP